MQERERRSRTAPDLTRSTSRPGTPRTGTARSRTATGRQDTTKQQNARRQQDAGRQQEARRQQETGRQQEARRQQETGRQQEARRQQARRSQSGRPGSKRTPARGPQSKRRRKRNLGIKIFLVIILAILAVVAAFLWKRYSPSKEKYDLKKYYGIEQEGQLAITVNNQVVEPHGMIADGKAYIQYDVVRKYINSRFYWDPDENILLYTLPKDMVSVEVGSKA